MKYLSSFELFENEGTPKPQNLKDLKKLMRKVSNDRDGALGYRLWGEFSTATSNNHRGNFRFIENEDFWNDKGEMSYTGSGDPKIYIDRLNKDFFNPLGWEMIDLGRRSVKVQKLAE